MASEATLPAAAIPEQDGQRFIEGLGVQLPDRAAFDRLADLTALRVTPEGHFYASNYLRGSVLYALVAARRPSVVLELGTGRGYGALCMARALVEAGIEGRVHSVDLVAHDRPIEWPYADERGPRVERWSRERFWREHVPREWTDRIVPLTGTSTSVMSGWVRRGRPLVDLAFVDGGHDRATARHDVLAAVALGSDAFGMLLDDVADRPGFGVAAVVREFLIDRFPVVLIPADWGHGAMPGAGMAWVDTTGAAQERRELARLPRRRGILGWPWR